MSGAPRGRGWRVSPPSGDSGGGAATVGGAPDDGLKFSGVFGIIP